MLAVISAVALVLTIHSQRLTRAVFSFLFFPSFLLVFHCAPLMTLGYMQTALWWYICVQHIGCARHSFVGFRRRINSLQTTDAPPQVAGFRSRCTPPGPTNQKGCDLKEGERGGPEGTTNAAGREGGRKEGRKEGRDQKALDSYRQIGTSAQQVAEGA